MNTKKTKKTKAQKLTITASVVKMVSAFVDSVKTTHADLLTEYRNVMLAEAKATDGKVTPELIKRIHGLIMPRLVIAMRWKRSTVIVYVSHLRKRAGWALKNRAPITHGKRGTGKNAGSTMGKAKAKPDSLSLTMLGDVHTVILTAENEDQHGELVTVFKSMLTTVHAIDIWKAFEEAVKGLPKTAKETLRTETLKIA